MPEERWPRQIAVMNQMAVCLQSGGLIDTESLSVQDGLQLNQFGINKSPNLPTDSFHFLNVFPVFLSIEPHYSSHFSLFAFCCSCSISLCLFISVTPFLTLCLLSALFFFFYSISLSVPLSLHVSGSLAVCFCIFVLGIGCRYRPVLALYNQILMSLHTDVNRNIRP